MQSVNEADKIFIRRCWQAVFRLIGLAKVKYFGKQARGKGRLHNGLPYFLCGGGSGEELYRRITDELKAPMRKYHFGGFRLEPLSPPGSLIANPRINKNDYHRVSVAFGLSHVILNLPQQNGFAEALLDHRPTTPPAGNTRVCAAQGCQTPPVVGDDYCYNCGH